MIQINNGLRDRAFQCAKEHGFHDKEYSDDYYLMLIISEFSGAIDAHRKGNYMKIEIKEFERIHSSSFEYNFKTFIKDSVEEELADIIIRCIDYCKVKNIDFSWFEEELFGRIDFGSDILMIFSKKLFTEQMFELTNMLISKKEYGIKDIIVYVFYIAKMHNINLSWHIEQKMKYNELRPMFNGKKY